MRQLYAYAANESALYFPFSESSLTYPVNKTSRHFELRS